MERQLGVLSSGGRRGGESWGCDHIGMIRMKTLPEITGNRTRVSRVTGGDTHHYAN